MVKGDDEGERDVATRSKYLPDTRMSASSSSGSKREENSVRTHWLDCLFIHVLVVWLVVLMTPCLYWGYFPCWHAFLNARPFRTMMMTKRIAMQLSCRSRKFHSSTWLPYTIQHCIVCSFPSLVQRLSRPHHRLWSYTSRMRCRFPTRTTTPY